MISAAANVEHEVPGFSRPLRHVRPIPPGGLDQGELVISKDHVAHLKERGREKWPRRKWVVGDTFLFFFGPFSKGSGMCVLFLHHSAGRPPPWSI